jgi:hypothetical protein
MKKLVSARRSRTDPFAKRLRSSNHLNVMPPEPTTSGVLDAWDAASSGSLVDSCRRDPQQGCGLTCPKPHVLAVGWRTSQLLSLRASNSCIPLRLLLCPPVPRDRLTDLASSDGKRRATWRRTMRPDRTSVLTVEDEQPIICAAA